VFALARKTFKSMNGQKKTSKRGFLFALVFDPNLKVHVLIEKMRKTKSHLMKLYYSCKIHRCYNLVISPYCSIGNNVKFPHPIGIVIGRDAVIGDNCTIFQNVTIGQKKEKFPHIGNNVTIYSGAQIIGDIYIGNNVTIGANAVVLNSIPDYSIAVGIPAKVIKPKD